MFITSLYSVQEAIREATVRYECVYLGADAVGANRLSDRKVTRLCRVHLKVFAHSCCCQELRSLRREFFFSVTFF